MWLLDLKGDSAKYIGYLTERGTPVQPSPDFHFAFARRPGDFAKPKLFICDFQKQTIKSAAIEGTPLTWWDNQSIVLKTDAHSLIIYHVPSETVSNLIDTATLTTFLARLNESQATLDSAIIFSAWSGKTRQLFLSNVLSDAPSNSFLARILAPSNKLQLLSTNLAPSWPITIDPTETWQVFTGDGHGVYLNELKTGLVRTLVDVLPAGAVLLVGTSPTNAMTMEIHNISPNFYNDTVIYIRDNALWQIDITGSNNTRLFPPP